MKKRILENKFNWHFEICWAAFSFVSLAMNTKTIAMKLPKNRYNPGAYYTSAPQRLRYDIAYKS